MRRVFLVLALACALPAGAQLPPDASFRALKPAEGLRVQLFAAEPMLTNPTAIDVDARGRVWVCEGMNYRGAAGPRSPEPPYYLSPLRKSGDRIVVLEDTDGDGAADKSRVFYEGLDVQAPLGIAVIGDKVWISQAPTIFTVEIRPDGSAGKKETVLAGFGGMNHDHCVHSVYLGPDGKLYGCFGNEGADVAFPDGRRLTTNGKPWWGGCAWRANPDLTGLEVLGHNYRNNYECATDSFGTTFMSDNDDDGNQWVRFTYVMDGGNYGFLGAEGRHWSQDGGTHFHIENPGVVPCLMRTGAGSPTGLCLYEGRLLSGRYLGMPIHTDAGPGVVQCFRVTPDGAAYRVDGAAVDADGRQTVATLSEKRKPEALLASDDRWFRPSDVCVAPDGSLMVADWYDPGVGGHGMGDPNRGRIYRIIPAGHDGSYKVPAVNVKTPEGLVAALGSPAVAARALAIRRIGELGAAAVPLLAPLAKSPDPILRARALFQLGTLGAEGQRQVRAALADPEPAFRVLAIRSLVQNGADPVALAAAHADDPAPHVRRELLLLLRNADAAAARDVLLKLANRYDGHDRFYLEAVGIAFQGREAALVPALIESWQGTWDRRTAGLLWRFRPPEALAYLARVTGDGAVAPDGRVAAIDALAGFDDPRAGEALIRALAAGAPDAVAAAALDALARRVRGAWKGLADRPDLRAAFEAALGREALRAPAGRLGAALGTRPLVRWRLSPAYPAPDDSGFDAVHPPETAAAPEALEGWSKAAVAPDNTVDIRGQRQPTDHAVAYAVCRVRAREAFATRLLMGSDDGIKVWVNGTSVHVNHAHRGCSPQQDAAAAAFAAGENRILVKVDQGGGDWKFIVELEDPRGLVTELSAEDAAASAPAGPLLDPQKLPPDAEILAMKGDAARGKAAFLGARATCSKCHRAQGEGGQIGPDLSAIGVKAGRDALLNSILRPSQAIAPEFAQWVVVTADERTLSGLLLEDGAKQVVIRDAEGRTTAIPAAEVKEKKRSDVSLMPEGLAGNLTLQELVDILHYLSQLK